MKIAPVNRVAPLLHVPTTTRTAEGYAQEHMNEIGIFDRRYPISLWIYLGLLGLFLIDVSLFSSASLSVEPFNAAIFGLLIFGLFTGSRACRWILIALSLITAFSILVIEVGSGNVADAMLVVIPLGQAGTLFSPSVRDFTDGRAGRPTRT